MSCENCEVLENRIADLKSQVRELATAFDQCLKMAPGYGPAVWAQQKIDEALDRR